MTRWSEALGEVEHRPYPAPAGRWTMHMSWQQLLFAHWPFSPHTMRERITAACGGWPAALELDTYEGQAWLSIVPFRMARTGLRLWPTALGPHTFLELNVRTYVTAGGKPGVFFFSLDAASPLAVAVARRAYHLPYFRARMSCTAEPDGALAYHSVRTHRAAPPAELRARYQPTGPPALAQAGSLEHWLTERYCLYAVDRKLRCTRTEVHHVQWPLRPVQATFHENQLASCHDFTLPDSPPLTQYVDNLDVIAWPPERVT